MGEYPLFTTQACPNCGRRYRGGNALFGFSACRCASATGGGHTTAECRKETGGCGHVHAEGHIGPAEEPDRMPTFGQYPKEP